MNSSTRAPSSLTSNPHPSDERMPALGDSASGISAGGPEEIVPTGGVRPKPRTSDQVDDVDDNEELPEGSDAPQDPQKGTRNQSSVREEARHKVRRPSSDADLPQPARG
jgi:hypothetical protein